MLSVAIFGIILFLYAFIMLAIPAYVRVFWLIRVAG